VRLGITDRVWFIGEVLEDGQIAPITHFFRRERAAFRRLVWYRAQRGPVVNMYSAAIDLDSIEPGPYAGQ
jgi:hypothetical protein